MRQRKETPKKRQKSKQRKRGRRMANIRRNEGSKSGRNKISWAISVFDVLPFCAVFAFHGRCAIVATSYYHLRILYIFQHITIIVWLAIFRCRSTISSSVCVHWFFSLHSFFGRLSAGTHIRFGFVSALCLITIFFFVVVYCSLHLFNNSYGKIAL